ncbi:uncharacterized protein LOC133475729 [Phyllopteryx taeniolatus]|uniref:uncharacterized protein LOC133475729 n=1 Tax=Phyllopteryx taeniolatus TaxID=161469 RepID=UPI002AD53BEE|nr:uncharacterized protein LOC133475729 [Phyllopteryx taeniolatus]
MSATESSWPLYGPWKSGGTGWKGLNDHSSFGQITRISLTSLPPNALNLNKVAGLFRKLIHEHNLLDDFYVAQPGKSGRTPGGDERGVLSYTGLQFHYWSREGALRPLSLPPPLSVFSTCLQSASPPPLYKPACFRKSSPKYCSYFQRVFSRVPDPRHFCHQASRLSSPLPVTCPRHRLPTHLGPPPFPFFNKLFIILHLPPPALGSNYSPYVTSCL